MTGQRSASSVTLRCFVPLSVHLASHMYGWTPGLLLSVMLLILAVYCCRYAMQRDVYATPSSGDGAGICSSFAFKAIHSKSALFFIHTPKMTFSSCYFGLKLHRHILGTPKANITSCKRGIIGAFKQRVTTSYFCSQTMSSSFHLTGVSIPPFSD